MSGKVPFPAPDTKPTYESDTDVSLVIDDLTQGRGKRVDDCLKALKAIWTTDPVEFEGINYRGIIDTPKTQKSKRLAALSSGLCRDLDAWLNRDPDRKPEDWVFPSEKLTTPLAKDNAMLRYIPPTLKTIGFDWVDFHVLRRTHSSLMRELGVDPKVVADQQGHTLDVNLNVYTETSLESRIEAVEQLESAFVN